MAKLRPLSKQQRLPTPQRKRRIRPLLIIIVAAVLSTALVLQGPDLSRFSEYGLSGTSVANISTLRSAAHRASAESEADRARHLGAALATWKQGAAPDSVVALASASTPRDVTEAVFHMLGPAFRKHVVLDVGANKGYPVTSLALNYGAAWVVSVEPDGRNFGVLSALGGRKEGTTFLPVKGAVSEARGQMNMSFDAKRDDFTCFDCLNKSREGVTTETVNVHTVDSLMMEGSGGKIVDGGLPVALMKTDTQGHEAMVLRGAKRLLGSGRVAYVIMEFDPKLLRTSENAVSAMESLFSAGMHCVQLTFAQLKATDRTDENWPMFGEGIGRENAQRFLEFVREEDKYTDLFCARKDK